MLYDKTIFFSPGPLAKPGTWFSKNIGWCVFNISWMGYNGKKQDERCRKMANRSSFSFSPFDGIPWKRDGTGRWYMPIPGVVNTPHGYSRHDYHDYHLFWNGSWENFQR